MKDRLTREDLVRAMAALDCTPDYGTIFRCNCGWRGPWYLMSPAIRFPGRSRCPECKSENTEREAR